MAYGDSLEATAKAQAAGYKGIDKNLQSTLDLVPIVNHSPVLSSFLGGRFTHRWSGSKWGEGDVILDPNRDKGVGARYWGDVQLVTDASGTQQLHTFEEHVADGVARDVMQIPESKAQPIQETEEFWKNVGLAMDRHGHPRVMMTLSEYGRPLARLKAAKAQGFKTAVLPRGARPVDFDTKWRPYVDALWGSEWGPMG